MAQHGKPMAPLTDMLCASRDLHRIRLPKRKSIDWSDGRIAEIFINGSKVGTAAETRAQDAAIVVSLALQHGCSIDTIPHALTRSGGSSGPVVALLDKAGTGA